MLAVALAVLVWVALGEQPAWAGPCPSAPTDRYAGGVNVGFAGLSAPVRLAYGREATVGVYVEKSVEVGRLEYVDASGQAFFSHALTPDELAKSTTKLLQFPIRVARRTGPVVARFSVRSRESWYGEPYPCDFTLELTVRTFPGVTPRLVTEDNEHAWRGDVYGSIFTVKPDDCEGIRPGRLRVALRHHGRKRVLVAGRSCSAGRRQAGRIMPGLRLGPLAWYGLSFTSVGRRSWTRSYRIDVLWNGTRIARRWLRVDHRVYPPHRIYANRDEESFYLTCEGGSDDTGHEGLPIHVDPERGEYCVAPRSSSTYGRILTRRPG